MLIDAIFADIDIFYVDISDIFAYTIETGLTNKKFAFVFLI